MFRTLRTQSRLAGRVAISFACLFNFTNPAEAAKPVNAPPNISGTPPTTGVAGELYTFQPSAADAEGHPLKFDISNKPAWAVFSSSTGHLSGMPMTADIRTFSDISIRVSDGKNWVPLPSFSITVTAGELATNHAPTIVGNAVTYAVVDRPYAFGPAASDADGNSLTFSIGGKPSWAAFDSSTGALYGTPRAANVGSYPDITISVSDGKLSTALAAFAITVAPAATKSVTLSWTAPTMNTDGTALTDPAGYTVFYGSASRQYSTSIKLPGVGTTSVEIQGLAAGTWYFSIKSSNVEGVESDYAGEVVAVL
jgi:hypothetical protein